MTSTADPIVTRPMSFAQRRLWFLQLLHGGGAYNNVVLLRAASGLDRDRATKAIGVLVERHEMLRTVFRLDAGTPVQIVLSRTWRPPVWFVTLPDASEVDDADLRGLAVHAARPAFRLDRQPPLRVTVIESQCGAVIAIVLVVHHIVWDAESKAVAVREILAACDAIASGTPPAVETVSHGSSYLDFAAKQHSRHVAGDFAKSLGYWRGQLAGLEADRLQHPANNNSSPASEESLSGSSIPIRIDAETTAAAQQFAHSERATLFIVLALGWFVLLQMIEGATDIVTGVDVSERDDPTYSRTIGLFVNQVAVRADLRGDPTLVELCRQVRRTCLEAYEHKDVPLDLVVRALQLKRADGRAPLFQTKIHYVEQPSSSSSGHEWLTEVDVEPPVARHELCLGLARAAKEVTGFLNYRNGAYRHGYCAEAARVYPEIVALAAKRPETPLSDIVAGVGAELASTKPDGRSRWT